MESASMTVDELSVFFDSHKFLKGYVRDPGETASEFTYGELTVAGVAQFVADAGTRFERINGRTPRCFLDLGSGSGKVVMCAAGLLRSLEHAVGVELSSSRHGFAVELLETLDSERPGMELSDRVFLIQDDVRRAVASIAAADIIWVSNTCFPRELNQAIGAVLDHYAQEGAIVYSTRDLLFSRRAGGVENGESQGDSTTMAASWKADHKAGTCVMTGPPLALAGADAPPSERAFQMWAYDELLPPSALVPAVADALLGVPNCPPSEVLSELFSEDGVLAEIIQTAADEHSGGLDFDAWEELAGECRRAVRGGWRGTSGIFSWLRCGF